MAVQFLFRSFNSCNHDVYITKDTLLTKSNYVCSVWSKMVTFQLSFWLRKNSATLLPTRYVLTIDDTFKMRYCMKLYLKGHQKYKQLHAIPHFKGLINGQSISGWHEWGFALHYQKPIWKVPILLHTEQTLYLLSVSSVIAQIRRWHLTNFYALSTAVLFVFW